MLRSRFNLLSAVAGSLSLLVLAGCPNAGTQPPVGASASPSAAPTASGSPSGSTTTPTTSPNGNTNGGNNGGSSASPSIVPSAPSNLAPTTVSGKVYDEDGAPVQAAKVRVRSLNPSAPFDSTVDVTGGAYVVNSVPSGVQVEVTASKENWTSRSRVTSLLPIGEGRKNVVNFGSTEEGDSGGGGYFISDFPEVVSAVADATTLKGEKVVYTVTLSEPLDATNRNRFQNNFEIQTDEDHPSLAIGPITLTPQSTFADQDQEVAFAWDTAGKVMTVTFNAPLWVQEDEEVTYRFRVKGAGEAIKDSAGNELGFGLGVGGAYYERPFRISTPVVTADDDTAEERWESTHSGSASFETAEDETDPTLTAVAVSEIEGWTRISLTFSEAMAAFGGMTLAGVSNVVYGTYSSPATGNVNNDGNNLTDAQLAAFTFAVAETAAKLDDVSLDGNEPADLDADVIGNDPGERETEFAFNDTDFNVRLSVNPNDAKILRLEVQGTDVFADNVTAIKARVEGISDPALNAITESNANANQKVGNI